MTVPTKWELTLPVLELSQTSNVISIREIITAIGKDKGLSPEEMKERLESGERRFDNRIRWAAWVLTRAGLLEKVERAQFKITKEGLDVLKAPPPKIDRQFLMSNTRYSEEVKKWSKSIEEPAEAEISTAAGEPKEIIESAHKQHNEVLASEILDIIKKRSPEFFEQLVVDLVVAMGYGGSRKDAGEAIGRTGDDGVDGVIKEDVLGLDRIYLQAKRWERNVRSSDVRDFIGAIRLKNASKGIMISTSSFPDKSHRQIANLSERIILIDGEQLTKLMLKHGVGVTEVASFSVNRIDYDYFGEKDE